MTYSQKPGELFQLLVRTPLPWWRFVAPQRLDGSKLTRELLGRIFVGDGGMVELQDRLPNDLHHVPSVPVHSASHEYVRH